MKSLIHIVYVSFSTENLSEMDLENLLTVIREKNRKQNVTGLLLYNDGSFIQVIEGKKETIHNLFEIIKKDTRHENIVLLLEEEIEKRAFPDWAMGYERLTKQQSSKLKGFSDFMETGTAEEVLSRTTSEVMHLLNSFKKHI